MAPISESLPERFPVGTKYVVESCGPVVRRYVEFPNGHKVILAKRMALPCIDAGVGDRSARKTNSSRSGGGRERVASDRGALTSFTPGATHPAVSTPLRPGQVFRRRSFTP